MSKSPWRGLFWGLREMGVEGSCPNTRGTRLVHGTLGGACEPYCGGHLLGPGSRPVCSQKTPSSLFTCTSTHWLILFTLHVPSAWNILPAPPLAAPAHLSGLGWSITSLEGPSRTILFPVEPPPPTNTLSNLLSFPDVGNAEMESDWGSALTCS